jgi:hypothetical protein
MERIKNEHIREIKGVRVKSDIIDIIEKKRLQWRWPRKKDGRGKNSKINCGMDTRRNKKKGTPWVEGVQAAMTARNLDQDQWRNREEWHLVSGR